MKPLVCFLMTFIIFLITPISRVQAIGPRDVTSGGAAVKWASMPVTVHLESDLTITKDSQSRDLTSLISAALNQWVGLADSSVSFTLGSLGIAVDGSNACDVLYDSSKCPNGPTNDGKNPLVIDEDGSIMAKFFGAGNKFSTLGFASIISSNSSTGDAVRGEAVFNAACLKDFMVSGCSALGSTFTGFTDDDFTSFIVHEIGHFLGLDHSQVNLTEATDSDSSNDNLINTMFPTFKVGNGANFKVPHRDDQVALAQLYPSSSFTSNSWSMTGTVYNTDGTTGFQCANLVARRTDTPRVDAISALSGDFAVANSSNGTYTLLGLASGVSYKIDVESIGSSFTLASGYTPCRGRSAGEPDPPQFTKFTSSGSFTSTAGKCLTVTCTMTSSGGDCVEGTGTACGGSGGCSLIR